jgi:hypothetical protein
MGADTYTTSNGSTIYESQRKQGNKKRFKRIDRGIYAKGNRYYVRSKTSSYGSFATLAEAQAKRDEVMPGGRGFAARATSRSNSET